MSQTLDNLTGIAGETVHHAAGFLNMSGIGNFDPIIGSTGLGCVVWGTFITLIAIAVFQLYIMHISKKSGGNRNIGFLDLIVTSEDESYSLSRLQVYIWTVVILTAVVITFIATGKLPDIPPNVYLLMGLTITTGVTASAVFSVKSDKAKTAAKAAADAKKLEAEKAKAAAAAIPGDKALADIAANMIKAANAAAEALAAIDMPVTGKGKPSFWRDLFYTTKNSLDLPRTQMFAWTVVILLAYIYMFLNGFDGVVRDGQLPDIEMGMVALMGISQGAYVGAKSVE